MAKIDRRKDKLTDTHLTSVVCVCCLHLVVEIFPPITYYLQELA